MAALVTCLWVCWDTAVRFEVRGWGMAAPHPWPPGNRYPELGLQGFGKAEGASFGPAMEVKVRTRGETKNLVAGGSWCVFINPAK